MFPKPTVISWTGGGKGSKFCGFTDLKTMPLFWMFVVRGSDTHKHT